MRNVRREICQMIFVQFPYESLYLGRCPTKLTQDCKLQIIEESPIVCVSTYDGCGS
jgi:hypothetical protein